MVIAYQCSTFCRASSEADLIQIDFLLNRMFRIFRHSRQMPYFNVSRQKVTYFGLREKEKEERERGKRKRKEKEERERGKRKIKNIYFPNKIHTPGPSIGLDLFFFSILVQDNLSIFIKFWCNSQLLQ